MSRKPISNETERLHFAMKVTPEFVRLVDDWRRLQPELISRAAAVRSLVYRGVGSTNGANRQDDHA